MGILNETTYIKKYVGSYDKVKSEKLNKKGIDFKKYTLKPTHYIGIAKIVRKSPHSDVTGYLINGKVYRAKNNIDRSLKSKKQAWEQ